MLCCPACGSTLDQVGKHGRGVETTQKTRLGGFSSCCHSRACLSYCVHVIGGQQQTCLASFQLSNSGSWPWRSGMRVSSCLLEAGIWRRAVGGRIHQVVFVGVPQEHGAARAGALQICRWGQLQLAAGDHSATSRWGSPSRRIISIPVVHCDPPAAQISGNFSDELESRNGEPGEPGRVSSIGWPRRDDALVGNPGVNQAGTSAAFEESKLWDSVT